MDMRTEQEVAEAFFSASTGNLESLNNMLGSQYKTFEEAKAGIEKNQGGLVEEMSKTLPGLWSTIVGKTKEGLKNFLKAFQEPLSGAMESVIALIDKVTPKLTEFAGKLAESFDTFSKSETAAGLMQIFQTVCETVWNAIGAVIDAVSPIIKSIMIFIGEHSESISKIVEALGTIWSMAWSAIKVALQVAWAIIEPPLGLLIDMLADVTDWVNSLKKAWEDAWNFITDNPITATINKVNNSLSGSGGNGNNTYSGTTGKKGAERGAYGLTRIPYNGYLTELHEGEKVLTKQEANRANSGANVTVAKLADTIIIREEMDIDRVAKEFSRKLRSEALSYA